VGLVKDVSLDQSVLQRASAGGVVGSARPAALTVEPSHLSPTVPWMTAILLPRQEFSRDRPRRPCLDAHHLEVVGGGEIDGPACVPRSARSHGACPRRTGRCHPAKQGRRSPSPQPPSSGSVFGGNGFSASSLIETGVVAVLHIMFGGASRACRPAARSPRRPRRREHGPAVGCHRGNDGLPFRVFPPRVPVRNRQARPARFEFRGPERRVSLEEPRVHFLRTRVGDRLAQPRLSLGEQFLLSLRTAYADGVSLVSTV